MNYPQGFNQYQQYYQCPPQPIFIQPVPPAPVPVKTKVCQNKKGTKISTCGVTKPITEFYDGKTYCKDCWKQYSHSIKMKEKDANDLLFVNFEQLKIDSDAKHIEDEKKIRELEERLSLVSSDSEPQLREYVNRMESEVTSKDTTISQQQLKISQLEDSIQTLNRNISLLNQTVSSLTGERDEFKSNTERFSRDYLQLKQKYDQLTQQMQLQRSTYQPFQQPPPHFQPSNR
jgi:archaellum component FlaC